MKVAGAVVRVVVGDRIGKNVARRGVAAWIVTAHEHIQIAVVVKVRRSNRRRPGKNVD